MQKALALQVDSWDDVKKYDKASAFEYIAKAQATAGDFQGAFETLGLIRSGTHEADTLLFIAFRQAEKGQFATAKRTAARIYDSFKASKINTTRHEAYAIIALLQAAKGELADARGTLGTIPNKALRESAEALIADRMVTSEFSMMQTKIRAGNLDAIIANFTKKDETFDRVLPVAVALVRAGRSSEAKTFVGTKDFKRRYSFNRTCIVYAVLAAVSAGKLPDENIQEFIKFCGENLNTRP